MSLATYALAALLALAPPAHRSAPPGWAEPEDAYVRRLGAVAGDVAAVSRTRDDVAALVGVAVHESGLSPDVDAGQCAVRWGCDGGRAVSVWQLQDADPERRDLYRTDRRAAAREALRRVWASQRRCAANAPAERLAAFASGSCARGLPAARALDAAVRHALAVIDPDP